MAANTSEIVALERLALRAWPAAEQSEAHGWCLRAAAGYTKRANSANALRAEAGDFAALLPEVEAFYHARGLRCVFRLSPLASAAADALLGQQGYAKVEPSSVMTRVLSDAAAELPPELRIEAQASPAWLDGFAQADALTPEQACAHAQLLGRIQPETGFIRWEQDGVTLAWTLVVIEAGWAGIFDVLVAPSQRGQGIGRRLTQAVLAWAGQQGATRAYLQVTGNNERAITLYETLGFKHAYGYHYRVGAAPSEHTPITAPS